jgi:hypothetical protein
MSASRQWSIADEMLMGSIPGAEPIKEFKEFVEDDLDDLDASLAARFE